jgi:hypothetical protein
MNGRRQRMSGLEMDYTYADSDRQETAAWVKRRLNRRDRRAARAELRKEWLRPRV